MDNSNTNIVIAPNKASMADKIHKLTYGIYDYIQILLLSYIIVMTFSLYYKKDNTSNSSNLAITLEMSILYPKLNHNHSFVQQMNRSYPHNI